MEEEAQVVETIRYKWLQKAYVFKEAIHTMKKSIILIPALLMLGLMLVSCSSEPQTTTGDFEGDAMSPLIFIARAAARL
ncbi:MAG: hypothetical protein DMF41_08970 [Verrucomicrobia bacterium]|nr:MAG: hypothetical protein DMF41_08970 [Verrucomicrobiota bacterium]